MKTKVVYEEVFELRPMELLPKYSYRHSIGYRWRVYSKKRWFSRWISRGHYGTEGAAMETALRLSKVGEIYVQYKNGNAL
jgi:hypothetical protein